MRPQRIRELYAIESRLKDSKASPDIIKEIRQKCSRPILESLQAYLAEKKGSVPRESPVGKAILYATNNIT